MAIKEPLKLNFYPYYQELLEKVAKNTTIRLGLNSKFEIGDIVKITSGWSEVNSNNIYLARITSVIHKKLSEITAIDLEGESPDCTNKEAIPYVLSAIYRQLVTKESIVTIIKWKKIENGQE
jgi:hypothetical protein